MSTIQMSDVCVEVSEQRGRSGSVISARLAQSANPIMLSPSNGAVIIPHTRKGSRRGSLLLIDGRRGSLLQVPGQQMEVRRGSIVQFICDDSIRGNESNGLNKKSVFRQLSLLQSEELAEQILYKGQYRLLNASVLFILFTIIFGIVFMSVWGYHDYDHEHTWVLFAVLGVVIVAISLNLMVLKLYFMLKRYNGG